MRAELASREGYAVTLPNLTGSTAHFQVRDHHGDGCLVQSFVLHLLTEHRLQTVSYTWGLRTTGRGPALK